MKQSFLLSAIALFLPTHTAAAADTKTYKASHNWPQWRGPLGSGVAPGAMVSRLQAGDHAGRCFPVCMLTPLRGESMAPARVKQRGQSK